MMGALTSALYRSFQNSQFKAVHPVLAPEAWIIGTGVRFGLPWPWQPSAAVDAPDGTEPVAQAEAPRTDVLTTLTLWRDRSPSSLDPIISTAGKQLADLHRGRLTSTRKVLVDGRRAIVATIAERSGMVVWRVVAEHDDRLLHGQLAIPERSAAGYQAHVDTMLGTWQWQ
jgi:hypothetical protein